MCGRKGIAGKPSTKAERKGWKQPEQEADNEVEQSRGNEAKGNGEHRKEPLRREAWKKGTEETES